MILPGSLRSTTLGDVLGQLHRGGVSGVLQIISQSSPWASGQHHVTLVRGIVRDVSTSLPAPRIGEVLLEQGVIRHGEYVLFMQEMHRRTGVIAGEILLSLGMVSDATLRFGLSRQMRKRLDALYAIDNGALRFHPLTSRTRTIESVGLGPRDFLHGRPRARDRGRVREPDSGEAGSGAPAREDDQLAVRDAALDLLGLRRGATRMQVRQAFRRAAVEVHPDLHGDLGPRDLAAMQARFAELSQAYHLLITVPGACEGPVSGSAAA